MIADIYYNCYNMGSYLKYARLAYDGFKETGYELNAYYTAMQMAGAVSHDGRPREAVEMLDSAQMLSSVTDSTANGLMLETYVRPLMKLGRYEEALSAHQRAYRLLGRRHDSYIDWADVANIYLKLGKTDSAARYIDKSLSANPQGSARSNRLHVQYLLFKHNRDYKGALEALEKSRDFSVRRTNAALDQNLAFVERDYEEAARIAQEKRADRMSLYLWLALGAIIALSGAAISYRIFRKREKIKETIGVMMSTTGDAEDERSSERTLQKEIMEKLFMQNFEEMDRLATAFFDNAVAEDDTKAIIPRFESLIDDIRTPEKTDEVCRIVNRCCGGVLDKIMLEFPRTRQADINFLAFVIAGFAPKSVCLFTGLKPMNFYQKRGRWIKKFRDCDSKDKPLFLKYVKAAE